MTDAWAIQVNAGEVEVRKPERGCSYCLFTFIFRIGAVNHRLIERYSKLRNFHARLKGVTNNLPHFPPKSWLFQNTTDVRFKVKRKAALLRYFEIIVRDPSILKLELFHKLLNLPDNLRRKMVKIAEDLDSKKYIIEQHFGDNSSTASDYRYSPLRHCKQQRGRCVSASIRTLTVGTPPLSDGHAMQTQYDIFQKQHLTALERKRERINTSLKNIHKDFKMSFPEKVQDDDELDNEIEELKEHPKMKKYKGAIKNYRIFSMEEVLSDILEVVPPQSSPKEVLFS